MNCTSHTPEQAKTVTLIDGRGVCSCSREWAHECECRLLVEKLDLRQRREHLAAVGFKRGTKAREQMEETIKAMWERRMGRAA